MTKKEKRALENSNSPFTLLLARSLMVLEMDSGNKYGAKKEWP